MQHKHVNPKLHLSLGLLTPTHPQFRTLSSTVEKVDHLLWVQGRPLDVTVFPATENTLSNMELTAGNGKTTLILSSTKYF